ncbi:DNA integrity scanning protein DisA [Alicyclobacillus hesperidum URH17-3-68]|uniref:diadenylate cyclase n=1 Tax=Alicyclobacillus hesperidum TaxID=89784 RepID=A0A1H2VGV0_9BACL|nr:DNA integrity scanning diadenylate cyclase DisA [Alicyclobacillus hesperidum]EJY56828.1 DNA integrity scanning protein DisA [Alicyclobacillus hesperidum URH17-3-68]GLG02569.1 DNA integrity scanning protein DisA [Alicyclobacillus hesperidum subsp. aegles]GLV12896.1 DNA integrity scanning protein DisA [Alicyclobacillus hesperidum]SDW67615.1 diadenylate cyclase [Alicyclobacillus hesperidum]
MKEDAKREAAINKILRMVAPGTVLREGIENILRAKTGGLIVVGASDTVLSIMDGGFSIQCELTPSHLYELAKMDGAIIISEDARRVHYANTNLNPDHTIPTSETGTRHRTAERVARQSGHLVICISQRRNVITLYQGNFKYVLRDIGVILTKANQALQTLEKYKTVLEQELTDLTALEFEEAVTLDEVTTVLQRFETVLRVTAEIRRYIIELGSEGRLVSMQLEELVANLDEQAYLLLKDFVSPESTHTPHQIMSQIHSMSAEELLDGSLMARALGYSPSANQLEETVSSRGYRVLNKISRLPQPVIENLVEHFGVLSNILKASIADLDKVEGVGPVRARMIRNGLSRIQEQVLIERQI